MEIEKYNPCIEAVDYRSKFNTFEEAWNNCERGDWMLWIAQKVGVDLRTLTKAKVKCAMLVQHLMKDERSTEALKVALDYSEGNATIEELYNASASANTAATAAYVDAAFSAFSISATRADASAYAATAAAAAATAGATAAYATAYLTTTASVTQAELLKEASEICREELTNEVLNLINKEN